MHPTNNSTVLPVVENNETKTLNYTYGDVANDVAYRAVSPVVENSEAKILNYTCDNPVVASDTLNQDSDAANDVAYRTVSSVVENSETNILNNTYEKPVVKIHNGNIANDARPQLNSKTTFGQYLDFSGKSTQLKSKSDNTKRSKKSTSRDQKPWFTRLSMHTRKQRKSTPKLKKVKIAHRIISRKIGKPQTKQSVHQNSTTELLTFCHTLTSKCDVLPFLSRL